MLWYDDSYTSMVPRARLRTARDAWSSADGRRENKASSARLSAFLAVAQALQGVADAALALRGQDDDTVATQVLGILLHRMARVLGEPPGGPDPDEIGAISDAFDVLADAGDADWRDDPVACRTPEGYAYYAVYPEAYAEAARRSGLGPGTQVIGLRSIGTGLAAMVAAALGAPPAATLRPLGDPLARDLVPGPGLRRRWREAGPDARFAVVDEGPGASGSSFRAAVRMLEDCGVSRDRIHLFPSHHNGPGGAGDPAWRHEWEGLNRHPADTDAYLGLGGEGRTGRLAGWIGELAGSPVEEVRDLSGGGWRALFWPQERDWPAAAPRLERRKVLVHTVRGPMLARFAGLGQGGEEKLALARALAACGFVPEPLGLAGGFLVERWQDGARPATGNDDRLKVLAVLPDYLAARAHLFPALGRRSASLPALAAMVRRNAGLRFGGPAESAAAALAGIAPALADRVRPVCIDGRLDLGEWLVGRDGRLSKADAIDHHDDHGLVGCQDIAWDVAGATVEFDLDEAWAAGLCAAIGERGISRPNPELVAFYRPCYAASRMAADCLALDGAADERERARLSTRAQRYAEALAMTLGLQHRG